MGLRLKDVQAWNLPAEDVFNDSDPTENLLENGATAEEVAFLRGEPARHVGQKRRYKGRRVELNAFTSDEFLRWLESKLEEHAISKVIPDDATLEQAFRRAAGLRKFRAILGNARAEVENYAENAKLPDNLRERLRKELELRPCQSWDDAIEALVPPVEQEGF